jgi:choline/glycine/proline betaine transport protein
MDWREMLADIVKRQQAGPPKEHRRSEEAVGRYLRDTVVPAFEALKSELAGHGRAAEVTASPDAVSLKVLDEDGREEFYYAVRAEAYRRMSFAFPELDLKEGPRREFRAEVALRSGPTAFDVTGYSQDQLIRNFLHEYRKWLGWRHGGRRPR